MIPVRREDLALSTMWNYAKARSGRELIDQIRALGFSCAELNYRVRPEWLQDVERAVRAGEIRVVSVHNVFPLVDDARFDTDSMLLGYEDEALRARAVDLTRRSLDWACRLGARALVIHPTQVPLEPERFDVPLKRMTAERGRDDPAVRALRERLLRERDARHPIAQTLRSLETLCAYIQRERLPVRMGLENRAMCHQIPLFDEFLPFLRRFDAPQLGAWLDTGHAILMRELGLQDALPQEVRTRIIGMHIHDAGGGIDHYAPCSLPGDVLAPFLDLIRQSPIRVLELSGRLEAREVADGAERLLQRLDAPAAAD